MLFWSTLIFFAALGTAYLFTALTIWINRASMIGQAIREEGPESHLEKVGTPTFGGIAIFISTLIFAIIFIDLEMKFTITALIVLFVLYGMIGFFDDYLKVARKKNLGLTARQKLIFQIIAAVAFLLLIGYQFGLPLWMSIPSYAFMLFIIVGAGNAGNLTDGLDGLWGGVAVIALLASAIIGIKLNQPDIALLSFIVAGATAGFLLLNLHPAKIFMGDLGALGLGAILAGIFICYDRVWWLLVLAIVPVLETLSVMAQVASFKLTGKRIFKMSPLHHHFELSGFSEQQVVSAAWVITFIAAVITVLMI